MAKSDDLTRFVAVFDLHVGWAWYWDGVSRRRRPQHDLRAWGLVLDFVRDFKPHVFIFGGDLLHAASVSHHEQGKPMNTEGLRLFDEVRELKEKYLQPVDELVKGEKVILLGNHERFLLDMVEKVPGIDFDFASLFGVEGRDDWRIIGLGGVYQLGKIKFIHGDYLSSASNLTYHTKKALESYQANVRYGHYHTFQAASYVNPQRNLETKTAVAVPCLSTVTPNYSKGPTDFLQGFLYGYVRPNGNFNDYVVIITRDGFVAEGKHYK